MNVMTLDGDRFVVRTSEREQGSAPSWVGAALHAYFIAIPVLWVLGLTLPVALLLMLAAGGATLRNRAALRQAWPWYAVAAAQLISVLANWALLDRSPGGLGKHLLSSYVSGWVMLGAAISAGAGGMLSLPTLARLWSRIAWSWLLLAVPAAAVAFAMGEGSLRINSPAGFLVPDSLPSKTFAFSMYIFSWDDLFGIAWPRIILFFPWANVLGMAGIAFVLAGLGDADRKRRCTLVAIGTLMVAACLGRLPIVLLFLSVGLHVWLGLSAAKKLLSAFVGCGLTASLALASGSPAEMLTRVDDTFQGARVGSSEVRSEIYAANWRGFYDAPLVGHGWPGEPVFERNQDDEAAAAAGMVVGSHSTISGLLFKGGLLAFTLCVLAFAVTGARLVRASAWSAHARSGSCVVAALAIIGGGESLESFIMPLLFVFVWLGAVLRHVETGRSHAHAC